MILRQSLSPRGALLQHNDSLPRVPSLRMAAHRGATGGDPSLAPTGLCTEEGVGGAGELTRAASIQHRSP
eukprot:2863882-Rhodomonas_salina.1